MALGLTALGLTAAQKAIAWALLNAGLGAMSGYQADRRKGGSGVGGALVGTGAGLAAGPILSKAGSLLAGSKAIQGLGPEAYKASRMMAYRPGAEALKKAAGATSTINPIAQSALGREMLVKNIPGAVAVGGTLLGAQSAAGGLAGGMIAGGGRNYNLGPATAGMPVGGPYMTPGAYYTPFSSQNLGLGYALKQGGVNAQLAEQIALTMQPIIEEAKSREFQRGLAAAQYRTRLGTESAMLQQSQLGAQRLGQSSLDAMGRALSSSYQYS